MPDHGSASLAEHLAAVSAFPVGPAALGRLRPESTSLKAAAISCWMRAATARWHEAARDGPSPFHPNADRLFLSAAEPALSCTVVVLSGMGKDGAEGASRLEAQGAAIYVQEPDTCVVAGMPRAALALCRNARTFDPKAPPEALRQLSD